MAGGKELFKLFGLIGMQGVEAVDRDLKKIDKQVRKAQKAVDRFGRKVSDAGKVLTKAFTAPIAAVAASVGLLAVKTGEYADKLLDLEQVTGLNTTKLQEYENVAREAGVSFEGFVNIISKFQGRMPQFIKGQGLAAEAMDQLGVNIKNSDGSIRDMNDLFPELLKKLHGVKDITVRNSIAQQIFGRSMADLAPVLSLSTEKIAEVTKEAHDMGLILDKEAIEKANNFRISMEKLKARITGAGRSLALEFIPVIRDELMPLINNQVIPFFEKLSQKVKAVFTWYGNLNDRTKKTVKGFLVMAIALGPVLVIVGKLIVLSKFLIPLIVGLKTATLSWAGAMGVLQKSVMGVTVIVIALVALGWYWYSQWDTLSVQLEALWAKIELFIITGANAILQTIADMAIGMINIMSKVSGVIPGLTEKLKGATIGLLKFKATLFKDLGKQAAYTNSINEQAEANENLTDTLKKAVDAGKEALGLKKEDTEVTNLKVAATKEETKAITDKAKEEKKSLDDRLAHEKSVQAQINELTLTKLELLEIERSEAMRVAFEKNADTFAVAELYILKEQALRDQIRKDDKAKNKKAIQEGLNTASTLGNKLNSVLSKFSDNKLKRLDNEEKKKIAAVENSALSEEEKETAIQKIQEETEKKRRKMERERAIREKVAALFNIAINTATAVVKALPNLPLSLFVGGLGIAEGVAVATAPLPFAEGGLIEGSQKGVSALVGEKNTDEIVFPLEKGIGLFIDGLMERLNSLEFPTFGAPALAAAGGPANNVTLSIGTFIGDERGLKELERRLDTIRIAENQRKGF